MSTLNFDLLVASLPKSFLLSTAVLIIALWILLRPKHLVYSQHERLRGSLFEPTHKVVQRGYDKVRHQEALRFHPDYT